MAVYIGTLSFESSNKQYKIMRCETHFIRHHNVHFPDAEPICDKLKLTITVDDTIDMTIQDWYINQTYQNGTVIYNVVSEKTKANIERRMDFKNAQCYSMQELYDNDVEKSTHELTIEIVPASITIDKSIEFKHP